MTTTRLLNISLLSIRKERRHQSNIISRFTLANGLPIPVLIKLYNSSIVRERTIWKRLFDLNLWSLVKGHHALQSKRYLIL